MLRGSDHGPESVRAVQKFLDGVHQHGVGAEHVTGVLCRAQRVDIDEQRLGRSLTPWKGKNEELAAVAAATRR